MDQAILNTFRKNAESVSTTVIEAKDFEEAVEYVLDVCEAKAFCEILAVDGSEPCLDEATVRRAESKCIAGPGLPEDVYGCLQKKAYARGFTCICENMRNHLAGVDIAFSIAGLGIAETATCILPSYSEDVRLASMVSEIHVIVLPKSAMVSSLVDAEPYLRNAFSGGAAYTACISGASRTSDIERELALGVHGPLELHVILVEG